MELQKHKWILDKVHSEITFKVKHLMISSVTGRFEKFEGLIEATGNDFDKARIQAAVIPASITTHNPERDKHLKSSDFFDAETFSEITFEGTSFEKLDEDNYLLKGILQIKNIKKEVSFDVDYGGRVKDPAGNEKAGFSFTGRINRKDWGLNWNASLERGGVLISDEVRINGELQFIKQ